MATEVKLTTDGLLLNWLKDIGDSVSADDIIAEFEADKATVEVEAGTEGVLLETRAEIGDELSEGAVIAVIGSADEAPSGGDGAAAEDSDGDAKADEKEQADAQPEKAEQPAAAANGTGGEAARTPDGRIKASPLAKRVAEEKGVDLAQISGSGPGGRIVKADVENFDPSQAKPAQPAAAPATGGALPVSYGKLPEGDDVEIIEMNRMRRAIAEGTVRSKLTTPHFYVTVDIDVAPLLKLRKQLNESLADEGIKISVNDMIVKATALTLKQYPNLNSHYYGDKIVRHKRVNVGISVALPNNGLVNVVSKDADKKSLSVLAVEHREMFERAREGKIKPDDVKDGTFTVSNLGPFNVDTFIAIIDPPQAGIIAVGSARKVPLVNDDGTFSVGQYMKVTISVDHRVSDGAEGAEWLNTFRDLLENPMRLLV